MRTVYDVKPDIDKRGTRKKESFPDLTEETEFWRLYDVCKPYSLLAIHGFYNIFSTIKYIAARDIPGDFVECGVFLGGASIFGALARDHFGLRDRKMFMLDTFEGFPEGTQDVMKSRGVVRGQPMEPFIDQVLHNIEACGVRANSYELIKGPVEETLHSHPLPEKISLLRLDTDFYDSTRVEFDVLYPRLVHLGVLIVDDYGLWEGARRATDEALASCPLLLHRVSPTVRSAIKA